MTTKKNATKKNLPKIGPIEKLESEREMKAMGRASIYRNIGTHGYLKTINVW